MFLPRARGKYATISCFNLEKEAVGVIKVPGPGRAAIKVRTRTVGINTTAEKIFRKDLVCGCSKCSHFNSYLRLDKVSV